MSEQLTPFHASADCRNIGVKYILESFVNFYVFIFRLGFLETKVNIGQSHKQFSKNQFFGGATNRDMSLNETYFYSRLYGMWNLLIATYAPQKVDIIILS